MEIANRTTTFNVGISRIKSTADATPIRRNKIPLSLIQRGSVKSFIRCPFAEITALLLRSDVRVRDRNGVSGEITGADDPEAPAADAGLAALPGEVAKIRRERLHHFWGGDAMKPTANALHIAAAIKYGRGGLPSV